MHSYHGSVCQASAAFHVFERPAQQTPFRGGAKASSPSGAHGSGGGGGSEVFGSGKHWYHGVS